MRCPCGSDSYAECCRPLHDGLREADTAVELMRSRYSAYALGLSNYVWRTWHPRTRPADINLAGDAAWTGLDIEWADDDTVAFVAHYDGGDLRETSRFARRAGRWFYLDVVP